MIALFYWLASLILLFVLGASLPRVFFGPNPVDRLLAVQIMASTCVALLLLLAKVMSLPAALDVALVFALLAAVTLVAFVRRFWLPENAKESNSVD